MASDEPTVAVPMACSASSAWNRSARMLTHRFWISVVAGYSSWSMLLTLRLSVIRASASGSIQVVTKVARFRAGLPSRASSSWMIW